MANSAKVGAGGKKAFNDDKPLKSFLNSSSLKYIKDIVSLRLN